MSQINKFKKKNKVDWKNGVHHRQKANQIQSYHLVGRVLTISENRLALSHFRVFGPHVSAWNVLFQPSLAHPSY